MMKCPVCEKESYKNICPHCGYHLDMDLMVHSFLDRLTEEEINEYKESIRIQKSNYLKIKELSQPNNRFKNMNLEKIYQIGYKSYVNKDYDNALIYLQEADKEGDKRAPFYLGLMYLYSGQKGFEKNYDKALKYFQKAGHLGSATAYKCLGDMYFDGKGVKEDEKMGLAMYQKAIEMGSNYARDSLIEYYQKGRGCLKAEPQKAKELKKKYKKFL